jgi:hypothetical protein
VEGSRFGEGAINRGRGVEEVGRAVRSLRLEGGTELLVVKLLVPSNGPINRDWGVEVVWIAEGSISVGRGVSI